MEFANGGLFYCLKAQLKLSEIKNLIKSTFENEGECINENSFLCLVTAADLTMVGAIVRLCNCF